MKTAEQQAYAAESPLVKKERMVKKNTSVLMDSNPIKAGAYKYSEKGSSKLQVMAED